MRLGNAAPRVAAADAQAAAKELAAAEKALQQAESELRQARSNRCGPLGFISAQTLLDRLVCICASMQPPAGAACWGSVCPKRRMCLRQLRLAMLLCSASALYLSVFVATLWRACLRVTMYTQQASLLIHTYLNVYTLSSCRDAAERDLAAAEKAVKQLELAAPKAAQLAAAKREEAADLEARLGQLQVGTWAPQQQLNVRMIHDPVRQKCVSPSDK